MHRNTHHYHLELTTTDGRSLGQFSAQVDWEPAVEWGRLAALRCWQDPTRAAEATISIRPVWHAESGAPFVQGVSVTADAPGAAPTSVEIPLQFFKPLAVRHSKQLVEQEKLASGERFNYSVTAFPNPPRPATAPKNDFDVEELPVPVNLKRSSLQRFLDRSSPYGEPDPDQPPVFVPQSVLDQVIGITESAGAVEAGSILIGHLHHDPQVGQLFLEVTEQIPARHAVGQSTRLTFNEETWTAVEVAISLRRNGEQMVGWFHSHPARFWCNAECPPEARARCPLTFPFFSNEDSALHRTVFWKSFCVAIVATNAPRGIRIDMYAWDRGMIAPRSFHIINANGSLPRPGDSGTVANPGDTTHETPCPN